jgi:hypothetical protein
MDDVVDSIMDFFNENPMAALIIAGVVTVLLVWLIRRSMRI